MNLKFLKSSEKKKLLSELNEKFGIDKLNYLLLETGKSKIRGFSGTMNREEIFQLAEIANVEIVGIYLFRNEGDLRIGFDGTHLLKIEKSVVEISDEDLKNWIRGKDLPISTERGIKAVKNGDDFFGCAISDGTKLVNHVPKERRIRN